MQSANKCHEPRVILSLKNASNESSAIIVAQAQEIMGSSSSLDTTECAVFGLFTALGYIVGIYFSIARRRKLITSSESGRVSAELEAFLGGRSLPGMALAVSILASAVNGMNIVAIVGHYYAHGFHLFWRGVWIPLSTAFVVTTVVPLLYGLRVATVFQYLRMRFDNKVGITACAIYFVLSQTLGAVGIYSAATAISTMLSVPLVYTSIAIGLAGTTYTALGGLRSVVWADCVQAAIMLACPIMIISKILHDSKHVSQPLRPLSDMNATLYILRSDFDATTDENMLSVLVACVPYSIVRFGCDQMSVQRYMAGRTAREAKRIAVVGGCLLLLFFVITATAALAVLYWYRDCDPLLSGAISNYDQILPYYIKERFPDIKTMRGLFLAGLLSATTSTVSSVVNSNAAMIYMDVIAPYVDLSGRSAVVLMHSLAFASGIVMTLYAMAVPVLGSATRLFVSFYSSASGPFSGLMLLAISSPWVKAKAAAWASLLVCGLQLWHAIGRSLSGVARPKVLYGTLDRCPMNTGMHHATNWSSLEHSSLPERSDVFPLYQISFFWISFIGALLTIFLGTIFSFSKGSEAEIRKNIRLTSPVFLKIWSHLTCFQQLLNMNERIPMACAVTSCDQGEEEYGALEIELLEAVEGRREQKGFK